MAASKTRVGIVGVGFGSTVYVPAFASEGWEVAALCSRHRDKARSAADAAGVRDVHTDAMELISRDDIDAVGIASPPATHHPLAIAAFRAGKHVLCEKPFALNARQAAEMRDAAKASGRTAVVGHEFRHTPQRAYIKELLDGGAVVSEYPPETPPQAGLFPRRNRLISGLADAVVVVEAPERSGALITAGAALDQGKDVFVVPGRVGGQRNRGGHLLIRDGARLVESEDDILLDMGWAGPTPSEPTPWSTPSEWDGR